MATIIAAIMLIGGLIAIVIMIIAIIYPEWFTHGKKSTVKVSTTEVRGKKDISGTGIK